MMYLWVYKWNYKIVKIYIINQNPKKISYEKFVKDNMVILVIIKQWKKVKIVKFSKYLSPLRKKKSIVNFHACKN